MNISFLDVFAPKLCICLGLQADKDNCVCPPLERFMRAYAERLPMTAMSPEQREECIQEVIYCSEGSNRTDYEALSDQDLARGVLYAWADYARDKGLL